MRVVAAYRSRTERDLHVEENGDDDEHTRLNQRKHDRRNLYLSNLFSLAVGLVIAYLKKWLGP
ncbi:MAG: hypothetical protein Q8P18_01750 [Pseudomonadota bacterium]|nr:hypothetical protein [Pseudomonadota bacterium]